MLLPPSTLQIREHGAAGRTWVGLKHWRRMWGRQAPLPLTRGLIPVHPISLTSLWSRERGAARRTWVGSKHWCRLWGR